MTIILPKEKIEIKKKNPKVLLIYSLPKMGKTTILSQLNNSLLIDLEDGSDYVEAVKYKVTNLKELFDLGEEIKNQNKPYKFLIIDTVTKLEEWCEIQATEDYKNSIIGKNFTGNNVIAELPKGAGYTWLRLAFNRAFQYIKTLADHIIIVGHLKESDFVVKVGDNIQEAGKQEASSFSIDLIGKDKQIACSYADAIGYMYKKTIGAKNGKPESVRVINFETKTETLAGSRPKHLAGNEIVISEKNEEGNVVTYWDRIYVE